MDINIMLFLQIGQFGIAYYFLYTFLFKPAYIILEDQINFEKKLYNLLDQEQHIKQDLEINYQHKSLENKSLLIQMIPHDTLDKPIEKQTVSYHIEKVTISKIKIQEAENFLVEQLSQVK